jgi:23S rRNA (cytidine1920-2'-O)/16S rRNA (cytidine1409-2'-O)-methyltransferase
LSRLRLDQLLVARGLAESRAKAKAAIEAGGVTVDGAPARAASQAVSEEAVVTYVDAFRWVGRGALKLERALDLWPVAVDGRVVLDVGASTGGFTEVCLDRGAAQVFAVDVGTGATSPEGRGRSARGESGEDRCTRSDAGRHHRGAVPYRLRCQLHQPVEGAADGP